MRIVCGENEGEFLAPVTAAQALAALCPEREKDALGAFIAGQPVELTETITEDCELIPMTYADEEGRRIYERSLRFVLLLAVRRVLPGKHLRIEHSVGHGLYMRLLEGDATEETAAALQAEMENIVREDLPFVRETWTREAAIRYFEREGQPDKTRLLAYRPYDFFRVYRCGGMAEYFYGLMLPSTGRVSCFQLLPYPPGMVLQLPDEKNPSVPSPFVSRPRHMEVFRQSNRWCDMLECRNAADLNDMTVGGKLPEFIRINEALHDSTIAAIAAGIRDKGARAVFVAGPSSSGKTTFSNRLCIHLRVLGKRPHLISLDDFYRDLADLPLESDGQPDLEALSALDIPYLRECLAKLLKGETAMIPRYDFQTRKRCPKRESMRLGEEEILVMEGIHGLNPKLHEGFDPALIAKVYISELTCLNLDDHNRIRTTDARLLRRIVRDHQFRGMRPEETVRMWDSVRRGEEKWIFPYQEEADFMFNSALHYELPVLRRFAYDLLEAIPKDDPAYLRASRLKKILHYMLPVTDAAMAEIPPLSLLREFIGGCTLY